MLSTCQHSVGIDEDIHSFTLKLSNFKSNELKSKGIQMFQEAEQFSHRNKDWLQFL